MVFEMLILMRGLLLSWMLAVVLPASMPVDAHLDKVGG